MYFVCIANVSTCAHVTHSKRDNKVALFNKICNEIQLHSFTKYAKQQSSFQFKYILFSIRFIDPCVDASRLGLIYTLHATARGYEDLSTSADTCSPGDFHISGTVR